MRAIRARDAHIWEDVYGIRWCIASAVEMKAGNGSACGSHRSSVDHLCSRDMTCFNGTEPVR